MHRIPIYTKDYLGNKLKLVRYLCTDCLKRNANHSPLNTDHISI